LRLEQIGDAYPHSRFQPGQNTNQFLKGEPEVKAASTQSVELGQTPAQVEAILGRPDKIVNLGTKKIYVYKDMKIVFIDEKVADVQ
jgi:hypothetical protein